MLSNLFINHLVIGFENIKEGEVMQIHDHLDDKTKRKLGYSDKGKGKVHSNKKKRNKGNSERLTRRDIEELMGTNRQTYRRVNGKIKSK